MLSIRRLTSVGVAFALALAGLGCPGNIDDPSRFLRDGSAPGACVNVSVPTVLKNRCGSVGCHVAGGAAAGKLDLVSSGLSSRIIGAKSRATSCTDKVLGSTTDVASSYLLEKVGTKKPKCGSSMPIGGTALSAMEIGCLRAWIAAGGKTAGDGDSVGDAGAKDGP